jgi:hypothetical protein
MISPLLMSELLLLGSALLLLLGTYLCWTAPRARMSEEEHEKDGKITAEQLRARIRFIAWRGPAVVTVGVLLLAFALLR